MWCFEQKPVIVPINSCSFFLKYISGVIYTQRLWAEKCKEFKHSHALTLSRDTPYIKPREPLHQAPPIRLLTLPASAAAATASC